MKYLFLNYDYDIALIEFLEWVEVCTEVFSCRSIFNFVYIMSRSPTSQILLHTVLFSKEFYEINNKCGL